MGLTSSLPSKDIESQRSEPHDHHDDLPFLYRDLRYPPDGLSRDPTESEHRYANILDTALAAPHQDGTSILLFQWIRRRSLSNEDIEPTTFSLARIYDLLFGRPHAKRCSSDTTSKPSTHPRIVRRLYDIPYGVRLERLNPGPIENLTLPPSNFGLPESTSILQDSSPRSVPPVGTSDALCPIIPPPQRGSRR